MRRISIIVLAGLLCQSGAVQATAISINTGTSPNWTVSAGGAADVHPYNVNGNSGFSITSTSFSNGTPVTGLNLATFDGYWTANYPFYLPANAVNVKLTYSGLNADDRTVLELNGVPIGTAGYSSGLGSMTFTDGGPNFPYEFAGDFTSGTITAGFIPGAPNLLQGIVNNTSTGINGSPRNISLGDGTDFGVQGTITYALVPEPSSLSLLVAGLMTLIARCRRASVIQCDLPLS